MDFDTVTVALVVAALVIGLLVALSRLVIRAIPPMPGGPREQWTQDEWLQYDIRETYRQMGHPRWSVGGR